MSGIEKIQKINVGEQVYNQLRKMIFDGVWKPGDKLPSEHELTSSFGVSRVTIRQALQWLAAQNIVETRLGEGSFVRELGFDMNMQQVLPAMYLSDDSLREVCEFRQYTESGTAALAAERATAQDVQNLWDNYAEMCKEGIDIDRYVEVDLDFHYMLTCITGNAVMMTMQRILADALKKSITDMTGIAGRDNGLTYHKRIIRAIENGDVEDARNQMNEHLESAYHLFLNRKPGN